MEEKTLEELTDSLQKDNAIIIVIDDDLSEGIYRIEEIHNNLDAIIKFSKGYCCIENDLPYFFWSYNSKTKKYEFYDGSERNEHLYIHEKVQLKLDLEKKRISYKEGIKK